MSCTTRAGPGREARAGCGAAWLGLLITCPPEPLLYRAECTDPAAESAPRQIVDDLLCRHLKPEEGVHAGKVPAKGGGSGRVHGAGTAAGPAQLEVALHIEAANRI